MNTAKSSVVSTILAATLFASAVVACTTSPSDDAVAATSNQTSCGDAAPCASDDPIVTHQIERDMRDGDSFEIPLDPTRKLEQITMIYDGRYSVPELDASGEVRKNDEGATYYKDGIYAHGWVIGEDGSRQRVAEPKFVDAHETDNWHDLPPLSGTTLRVEFAHADRFRDDPDVVAARSTVRMTRVIVQYKDPEGLTFETFDYDKNSELQSNAEIPSGGAHTIEVDGARDIYRVDVRWGDAKPRDADGRYVPGQANGYITVDGRRSESRNVAAIETQVFGGLVAPPLESGNHQISVHMNYDSGRVHWIKVYYR